MDRRRAGRHAVSWTAVALLLAFAGLLAALVVMLDRQAERTNRQQATVQLRASAEIAANVVAARQAELRARAAALAASTALQRAVAKADTVALRRLASTNHARIAAGDAVVDRLPRAPRLTAAAVLRNGHAIAARVTLGMSVAHGLLQRVPLPPSARLVVTARGRVVDSAYLDVAAKLRTGFTVHAVEPLSAVSARSSGYLRKLVLAALLTFMLAVLIASRLARPISIMVGDLSNRAERDPLTGLVNRRTLDERLREELERAERYGTHLAFVLLDVDDFKQTNDRYGHQAGDAVLQAVASVLAGSIRELDVASRFGGEEFALLLPGTAAAGGVRVAEEIRHALTELDVRATDGRHVPVTASFGVADFPCVRTVDELVASADAYLYEAKGRGKNRVESAVPLVLA